MSDCPKRCVPCRVGCGLKLPFESARPTSRRCASGHVGGHAERVGPETTREVLRIPLPAARRACPSSAASSASARATATHLNLFCPNRISPAPRAAGGGCRRADGTAPRRRRRDLPRAVEALPFDIVRVNGREGRRLEVKCRRAVHLLQRAQLQPQGAFKLIYPDTVRWQRLQDLTYNHRQRGVDLEVRLDPPRHGHSPNDKCHGSSSAS